MRGLWQRSFPEVVASANEHAVEGRHLQAAQEYWLAAYVAPTDAFETEMLLASWVASERAGGRRSELEAPR